MLSSAIGRLRAVALIEGVSFLLLLFIAMPIKYLMGHPIAVKITGMLHGLLFLAFCYLLLNALMAKEIEAKKALFAFIASIIPFGPFFYDKRLKEIESQS